MLWEQKNLRWFGSQYNYGDIYEIVPWRNWIGGEIGLQISESGMIFGDYNQGRVFKIENSQMQ